MSWVYLLFCRFSESEEEIQIFLAAEESVGCCKAAVLLLRVCGVGREQS